MPMIYADGYLEGQRRERQRGSSLRVAAKMVLKGWKTLTPARDVTQALLGGIAALRVGLKGAYQEDDEV